MPGLTDNVGAQVPGLSRGARTRGARGYGVDINPHCKSLEEDGVEIFIGDQADRGFLRSIAQRVPRISCGSRSARGAAGDAVVGSLPSSV